MLEEWTSLDAFIAPLLPASGETDERFNSVQYRQHFTDSVEKPLWREPLVAVRFRGFLCRFRLSNYDHATTFLLAAADTVDLGGRHNDRPMTYY